MFKKIFRRTKSGEQQAKTQGRAKALSTLPTDSENSAGDSCVAASSGARRGVSNQSKKNSSRKITSDETTALQPSSEKETVQTAATTFSKATPTKKAPHKSAAAAAAASSSSSAGFLTAPPSQKKELNVSDSSTTSPTSKSTTGKKKAASAPTSTTAATNKMAPPATEQRATAATSPSEKQPRVSRSSSSSPSPSLDMEAVADQQGVNTNEGGAPAIPPPPVQSLSRDVTMLFNDTPQLVEAYNNIPVLELTKLPRGGISVDTKAVGRVQFGIPPETIKDSMQLGIPVPQVYIVPVERFCREMGPALGVNLAEFEFPAYFNFFVYNKQCTLVVDNEDAEDNIRRVFSETLLGPAQFRDGDNPVPYMVEDFAPDFPRDHMPNFTKELGHFRKLPGGRELCLELLLHFRHFEARAEGHHNLGVPAHVDLTKVEASDHAATDPLIDANEEEDSEEAEREMPKNDAEVEQSEHETPWTYSHARYMGDVATVWPSGTTDEQKKDRSVARLEVFKMPGGTEYIIHDIDENNHIIGKSRFPGHVKVSDQMSVEGFGGHSIMEDLGPEAQQKLADHIEKGNASGSMNVDDIDGDDNNGGAITETVSRGIRTTFNPPSFGVTVLGNSHGFDKSGSTSGYVLWINGRGVMIDPPPYATATLQREGIRPRLIVGIILTHCHADHDAGAFQKILTGSPVVVITTPTIYKSFIRKYAALSALSPALLRHCHRYKPAIIGQPLRFQGATFHFIYSLHAIPCVGFQVEWRGRSMVFTGDHMHIPDSIATLQDTGVLTKARADDLLNLPLRETDLLLHESGAPPIHTPLAELLKLPDKVKKRMYVVHTSALPDDCELKVAPTGTAGTIRLDHLPKSAPAHDRASRDNYSSLPSLEDNEKEHLWSGVSEYETISEESLLRSPQPASSIATSFVHLDVDPSTSKSKTKERAHSVFQGEAPAAPLVSLRPASSTDAWFILNLLSAVPFMSSLSYASTMEVLETAKVDAHSVNNVIIPAARRNQVLCVVWEGACGERKTSRKPRTPKMKRIEETSDHGPEHDGEVWHAGDWTGPISLQPERRLSGESDSSSDYDVVAISDVGVKVITIDFTNLHMILKSGSPLYRKYLERKSYRERAKAKAAVSQDTTPASSEQIQNAMLDLNVLELLNCNSALRKLNAVQKRHLESLAEGPLIFKAGERLWRGGAPVDRSFLIVSGTASFVPKRRNAGSAANFGDSMNNLGDPSLGDSMQTDAIKAIKELGGLRPDQSEEASVSSHNEGGDGVKSQPQLDNILAKSSDETDHASLSSDGHDFSKLSRGLQKRADFLKEGQGGVEASFASDISVGGSSIDDSCEDSAQLDYTFTDEQDPGTARARRGSVQRRRSSRARHYNKVLGRLYSRRAYTGGLVFSRGHFLGDVSKMVAGSVLLTEGQSKEEVDMGPSYGFGDDAGTAGGGRDHKDKHASISTIIIHEQEGDHHIMHSSTLTAGKDGCIVLVFPKSSLIPFLDEYPGLLLSLLGTQVVV